LVFAVAVVAAGCDQLQPAAVEVDSAEVSRATIDRELGAIAGNGALREAAGGGAGSAGSAGSAGTLPSDLTARWLTFVVEDEVVASILERRDVKVTRNDREAGRAGARTLFGSPEVFAEFPGWFRERVVALLTRRAAAAHELGGGAGLVTDAEVQAAYEERVGEIVAQCPPGVFVAHILVETAAAADAIAAELAGGASFAELARERSTDQGSAEIGGELGCFDPAQYDPAFANVASLLTPGVVSPPVQTQFGFHLIRLDDTIPLEAVEPIVREDLEAEARSAALENAEINQRAAEADVDIDPRYGRWVVRDGAGAVEPPPGAPSAT